VFPSVFTAEEYDEVEDKGSGKLMDRHS